MNIDRETGERILTASEERLDAERWQAEERAESAEVAMSRLSERIGEVADELGRLADELRAIREEWTR